MRTKGQIIGIFSLLVVYLLAAGFYALQQRQNLREGFEDAEEVRLVSEEALKFSEENYHAQLELWEYVYHPTATRLEALHMHEAELDRRLEKLSRRRANANLPVTVLAEIRAIEAAAPVIRKNSVRLVETIGRRAPPSLVREIASAVEDYFDLTRFNQRVANLTEESIAEYHRRQRRIVDLSRKDQTSALLLGGAALIALAASFVGGRIVRPLLAKNTEAQTRLAQQEIQILRQSKFSALGEMAGGIAHEINNPLATIRGSAYVIRRAMGSAPQEGQALVADAAEKIERTSERIAKIVRSLRLISRDGSADPLQKENLQSIIEDAVGLCGERFRNRSIELTTVLSGEKFMIECRATQIVQIVVNLLNNAFDAVENLPGDEKKWVRIDLREAGEQIEVRVTNCGPPVPDEVRKRLGEPFFTTKPAGKGTGLGLTLSSSIAHDHGGTFFLDEKSREPSFVVRLPREHKAGKGSNGLERRVSG